MNTKVTQEEMKLLFSNRLNDCMEKEGITQEKLSKKVGISRPNIAKYLSARSLPGAYKLNSIANFFGVSCDYLIGREDGVNNDISHIMEYTGLSQTSVELLNAYSKDESLKGELFAINALIESIEENYFFFALARYIATPSVDNVSFDDDVYASIYSVFVGHELSFPMVDASDTDSCISYESIKADEVLYYQLQKEFDYMVESIKRNKKTQEKFTEYLISKLKPYYEGVLYYMYSASQEGIEVGDLTTVNQEALKRAIEGYKKRQERIRKKENEEIMNMIKKNNAFMSTETDE